MNAEYAIQRFGQLKSRRGNWESQWEEAAKRVIPEHSGSFNGNSHYNLNGSAGQKKTQDAYDSTAILACARFASVMESIATPQNAYWHSLAHPDKQLMADRSVRKWFQDLTHALFAARYAPNANFIGNVQQFYMGLGAYGNGILFIDEHESGTGLRYRNIHLGEAYFVTNHAGRVDTMYRCFRLTARQIVEMFEDVPESVRNKAQNPKQKDEEMEILHVVEPRRDRNPERKDAMGMPYASCYFLTQEKHKLHEGGYRSFPYAVGRYQQAPNEEYGRGPAQMVLPSIKVVNQEKKDILTQAQRVVNPVLLAHDDGNLGSFTMRGGKLNTGGISAEGRRLIDVLPTGNLAVGFEMMEMEQKVINDAFLITLFQILVETPQMTATEVLERAREKGMLIAPTAGRLQNDTFGQMIFRELEILGRQGKLPPPPGVLMDGRPMKFHIEFNSPMSRMREAEQAAGFFRALQQALEVVNVTQDPSILDHFDFEAAMPAIQRIQGAPVEWTRAMDQIEEIRAQRQQAQQQQQMVEAMPAMTGLAKVAQGPKENQIP